MGKRASTIEKEYAYRENFLAHLTKKLAIPTDEWPTVRCWTDHAYIQVCESVRKELADQGIKSSLTSHSLTDWISGLGILQSISTDSKCFYLLDIGASVKPEISPFELLMAARPSGVICYLSAVAYHGLTTQLTEQHYIAELQQPSSTTANEHKGDRVPAGGSPSRKVSGTTGTLLFHYQERPFYYTRRSTRLIPGIQVRAHGPRSQVRITTLEQTLLDTLHKPFYCGGPEVVFEAWHHGLDGKQLDEERLVRYLEHMNYPASARRLAAMMELFDYQPGSALTRLLDNVKSSIDASSPYANISLLPGMDYQNLNKHLLVRVP